MGFTHAPWIPRGRQANPQLCSRGTLSVNGIFLELSRSSGKRTQHVYTTRSVVIYGCASREIKRATFLAFYRSSTMAARACPEFSPRIVSPRQVSGIEDRASPPFRSNYYPLYIYLIFFFVFSRQRSIIFQGKHIKLHIFVHIFTVKRLIFHITRFIYIYEIKQLFYAVYVISIYTSTSRRNIIITNVYKYIYTN